MTRVEKKQGQRLRRERQREGNAPDLFPRHLLFPQECSDTHTPSRPFSYVITKVIFSVLYYFLPRDRMMSPRQSKQKICDPSASLFISGAGEELGGSDWILTLLTCQSAPQRRRFISLSLSLFRLFFFCWPYSLLLYSFYFASRYSTCTPSRKEGKMFEDWKLSPQHSPL